MNGAADQVMDLIFSRWRSQILSAVGRALSAICRVPNIRAIALDRALSRASEQRATDAN
jgi:hypothetical protein